MDNEQADIEFHNVRMTVTEVADGRIIRNPHQNIKAIVNLQMDIQQAILLRDNLDKQIVRYQEGMGPLTATLKGEFTSG